MNAPLHLRALCALPQPLQAEILNHTVRFGGADNIKEVTQSVWLAMLSAGASDTPATIFGRARSCIREQRKGRFDRALEKEIYDRAARWKRAEVVRWVAAEMNCSIRRAQQIVAEALKTGVWDGPKRGEDE